MFNVQHDTRSAPAAIDRHLLSAGRSTANPPAAVDRWDRETNGRTARRYIDPAPHTMRAASTKPNHTEPENKAKNFSRKNAQFLPFLAGVKVPNKSPSVKWIPLATWGQK